MATGIFCTNAEVERKAGANASATSSAVGYTDDYITQAESLINSVTTFNWSDAYGSVDVDTRGILKMAASAWAAIAVIRYDMSGFTSRQEALTMINSLLFEYNSAIKELKEKDTQEFIKNA